MQIYRSRHERGFTVLPNYVLQDRRLSFTARGLLADLLSRPDGWRDDGRRIADSSPEGRVTVAKALRELTRHGYYRVEKIRRPDGTVVSQAHVYDSPCIAPQVTPGSGEPDTGLADAQPPKDREKVPTHPLPACEAAGPAHGAMTAVAQTGRAAPPTVAVAPVAPSGRVAVATLFRVIRPERRLHLGPVEAMSLAPLVDQWLARGATEHDLAAALLPGLPNRIQAPAALLRARLQRKLPPVPATTSALPPGRARWYECAECARPTPTAGLCRACAGFGERLVSIGAGHANTARGMARVRVALTATAVPSGPCPRWRAKCSKESRHQPTSG